MLRSRDYHVMLSCCTQDADSAPTVDELGLRDLLNDEGVLATPSFPTHQDKY